VTPAEVSLASTVRQLRDLGVRRSGVLLVHTSYRAVRPVERGPDGLIAALLEALGPGGTLVMPCWSGDRMMPFDSSSTPADGDLGVVAEHFRHFPGVLRGRHRFAFAACGPLADAMVGDPVCFPPHGPPSATSRVRDRDGQVLLLGCPQSSNTTIHLAEVEAGVGYRRHKTCLMTSGDASFRLAFAENDHCCDRFDLTDGWLGERGLLREGPVGNATAHLMDSRDLVDTVVDHLAQDPEVFLHPPGTGCAQCDEARAGAIR